MTAKDRNCLRNMLEFAERVERRVHDMTYEQFSNDEDKQDMILYALGQIGENADSVSDAFQEEHPEILWSSIIGLRNRIFHVYENINMKLVYDVASNNIPDLVHRLRDLLK